MMMMMMMMVIHGDDADAVTTKHKIFRLKLHNVKVDKDLNTWRETPANTLAKQYNSASMLDSWRSSQSFGILLFMQSLGVNVNEAAINYPNMD